VSADDVDEMVAKYDEIARLRRGDADGSIVDPRPAMRALAARFPGALRELDRLTMAEIERRLAHLRDVKRAVTDEAPWVALVARFHRLMRDELRGMGGRPLPRGHRTSAFIIETLAAESETSVESIRALLMPWVRSREADATRAPIGAEAAQRER
jgi:hypothetical protein